MTSPCCSAVRAVPGAARLGIPQLLWQHLWGPCGRWTLRDGSGPTRPQVGAHLTHVAPPVGWWPSVTRGQLCAPTVRLYANSGKLVLAAHSYQPDQKSDGTCRQVIEPVALTEPAAGVHSLALASLRTGRSGLDLDSSDVFWADRLRTDIPVSSVLSMGWGGGQGRNRTADASLFRAARSTTYRRFSSVFIDIQVPKVDSIWTPGRSLDQGGLQVDSSIACDVRRGCRPTNSRGTRGATRLDWQRPDRPTKPWISWSRLPFDH